MFDALFTYLKQNQFVTAGLLACLAVQSKNIGKWIRYSILRKVTASVTVSSQTTHIYYDLCEWLFASKAFKGIKTIELTAGLNDGEVGKNNDLGIGHAPASGTYFGFMDRKLVWITTSSQMTQYGSQTFFITISCFALKLDFLESQLKKMIKGRTESKHIRIAIGDQSCSKRKRKLSSVICEFEQGNKVLNSCRKFLTSKSYYEEKGLPYRLGLLLEGPPGTGKTSFLFALACELNMPILSIPSGVTSKEFTRLMCEKGNNKLIVIEDVDASSFSVDSREEEEIEEASDVPANPDKDASGKVSLSTLLNCMDGLPAPEGSVIVLTTNHPDKLDPAIVRAGRINLRYKLDYFSREFAISVVKESVDDAEKFIESNFPGQSSIQPAALMQKINEHYISTWE